jgi:hypothetical protein
MTHGDDAVNNKLLLILVFSVFCWSNVYAQSPFGNPVIISKDAGLRFSVSGGESKDLTLDFTGSRVDLDVNAQNYNFSIKNARRDIDESSGYFGVYFSPRESLELFGKIGFVNQEMSSDIRMGDADVASSYALGLRISPVQKTDYKIGFMAQVRNTKTEYAGLFDSLGFPNPAPGVGGIAINDPLDGKNEITLTQFDALIGVSKDFGSIQPYGGIFMSYIQGNEKLSVSGVSDVTCSPACSVSGANVGLTIDSDIESADTFGGVLGIGINQGEAIGASFEVHFGAHNGYYFLVDFKL